MEEHIVSAARLSKTYRVYARPWHRLRELVLHRPCHQAFHALQDVSFDLRAGDSLGIVGENGAGKSTLLKILSGVTAPTRGEIAVRGKVASLLELGMGFHPEFSGRRNIALTAALMGLSQAQVEEKVPEIIAFSELGDFIDRPVKTYSTGMAMRLGFSIAVQMEPDILIIDEALSVGDGYFRKKCMDRIRAFLDSGRTLLFCSHAMYYVSSFCQRALWLRQGRMEAYGPVEEVVRAYENFLSAKSEGAVAAPAVAAAAEGVPSPARIVGVRFVDRPEVDHSEGGDRPLFHLRDPLRLEIEWRTEDPRLATHVGVGINRSDGFEVCAFGTHRSGLPAFTGRDSYRAHLVVPELPLVKGEFSLYVFLLDEVGLHVYDQLVLPAAFSVKSPIYHFGVVDVGHRWEELAEPAPLLTPALDSVETASV